MNNELQPIDATSEIVLYQPDENIKLDVRISNDTVWLTRNQMATLFGRDVKTIGKHINNALREELAVSVVAKNAITDPITTTLSKNATLRTENPVVAKFATTASDGKVYQTEHYSLDMILSVGYRVHSPQGIAFRAWANQVLKQYLLRGYAINHQLVTLQQTSHTQTTRTIDLRTTSQRMHDRFLIIDDTVYHLGASLNELGKRLFAFSKMSISKTMLV